MVGESTRKAYSPGMAPEPSGKPADMVLRCRGCDRTVKTDRLPIEEVAELISWDRDEDGVWCVMCQWKRGRTPRFFRRIARPA